MFTCVTLCYSLLLSATLCYPTNVTLQQLQQLRVPVQARVLQLFNSVVCFFFPCRPATRAAATEHSLSCVALRLLAGCTSQGTTDPIASLRTLIGVLANVAGAETPCSFCSSTSWGQARGQTGKDTQRDRPPPAAPMDPRPCSFSALCCQCGERVEGASLDHEMGLVSALCCKTGCTQCPRGCVFCTVLECKQRAIIAATHRACLG